MNELVDEMRELAKAGQTVKQTGYAPLNKWIVRSGLQKAIRRGRTEEALMCGANLATADSAGAWRALATIIVEDVGVVDPDLLTYSTVAGLTTMQKQIGLKPADLFKAMVVRACQAPVKTRSACELSLGADKDPETKWGFLHKLDDDQLLGFVAGPGTMPMQYAATCVAKKRCRADKSGKLQERVLQIMMDSLGTGVRARAAMMSFERQVNSMNSAVWPLLMHGYDEGGQKKIDAMPPEVTIGGASSAAYDMHTLQGKKAIKAFHTSLVKKVNWAMTELAAKSDDVVKGLGSIIFILEGGQVAPYRLWSEKHAELKAYQDENFSRAWGCPPELYKAVTETVLVNFELLNSKREWAAANT